MVNLLFSIYGRVSRGPFWLVYLILLPVISGLIFYYRNINQQESSPHPDCVGPLCLDRNLHHRETVARYGCDGVAFDSCRSNSNAVILVGSFPGAVGRNQFGPDPLQRNAAS